VTQRSCLPSYGCTLAVGVHWGGGVTWLGTIKTRIGGTLPVVPVGAVCVCVCVRARHSVSQSVMSRYLSTCVWRIVHVCRWIWLADNIIISWRENGRKRWHFQRKIFQLPGRPQTIRVCTELYLIYCLPCTNLLQETPLLLINLTLLRWFQMQCVFMSKCKVNPVNQLDNLVVNW